MVKRTNKMAGIKPRILTVALSVDRLNTLFLEKEKEKHIG